MEDRDTPNEVAKRMIDAQLRKNIGDVLATMDENIVFRVQGERPLSGEPQIAR